MPDAIVKAMTAVEYGQVQDAQTSANWVYQTLL